MSSAEEIVTHQKNIDALDREMAELLVRRFDASRRIGEIKRLLDLPSSDPQRIVIQRSRFVAMCEKRGLSPAMAETLIEAIVEQVLRERASVGIGR